MPGQERQLNDLISVGPAMLRDFKLLGVRSAKDLARRNPEKMYFRLNRIKGQRQDICCLDVFCTAVAQAQDLLLPPEKSQWWYWSRTRKAREDRHD